MWSKRFAFRPNECRPNGDDAMNVDESVSTKRRCRVESTSIFQFALYQMVLLATDSGQGRPALVITVDAVEEQHTEHINLLTTV